MAYVFLILISIAGLALCGFYLKKNIVRIKDKNKDEPSKYMRIWNYVPTGLWYGYLILFFAGLTINNLIFLTSWLNLELSTNFRSSIV